MACLYSDKVRHDKEDDPNHVVYKKIQANNHNACDLLSAWGFRGNKLKVHLKKSMLTAGTVTAPHSQERIEALAGAKSHGSRFLITGGGHMCTDDIFRAMELKACREKREVLKKDKAACKSAEDVEKKALAILGTLDANKKLT